jgi:pimeloyl-ACP methyl ester carboxylesterase
MAREGKDQTAARSTEVVVPPIGLMGILRVPDRPRCLVVFVHGSGSSRHSPRNTAVALALADRGIASLLFDLLTADEEADRANVFDVDLLAERLIGVVEWVDQQPFLNELPLALFGASTGAAAALVAAARLGTRIRAVVSRGGRPDLAADALDRVASPTLLIVGGADESVLELNRQAMVRLPGPKQLRIIAGATHLFSEPGALDAVTDHAAKWFLANVGPNQAEAK